MPCLLLEKGKHTYYADYVVSRCKCAAHLVLLCKISCRAAGCILPCSCICMTRRCSCRFGCTRHTWHIHHDLMERGRESFITNQVCSNMTQIHKVYLMWPHSNTSGIITFITKEPFFGAAVPYKPLFLLSSPNRIKSRKRCYFVKPLPPRRNYAIVCHEFKKDTTTLEAPMTNFFLKKSCLLPGCQKPGQWHV